MRVLLLALLVLGLSSCAPTMSSQMQKRHETVLLGGAGIISSLAVFSWLADSVDLDCKPSRDVEQESCAY